MSTLRIFNVSDYVHAGGYPRANMPYIRSKVMELADGSYGQVEMPVGGISFMLNAVIEYGVSELSEKDILVFCIDSAPTVKREMYRKFLGNPFGYKGTRAEKSLDISIQREMIEDVLSLVSPNVFSFEGYEADDIIYTLCRDLYDYYDEIIVHTRDTDLYVLVNDKVSIAPVGTQGHSVNIVNYSNTIISGRTFPYNSIAVHKLFHSDKSDNIPGIADKELEKLIYNNLYRNQYSKFDDFDYMREVISSISDDPRLLPTLDLILPLYIEDSESYFPISTEDINVKKVGYLGYKVGNKYTKGLNMDGIKMDDVDSLFNHYLNDYASRGGF